MQNDAIIVCEVQPWEDAINDFPENAISVVTIVCKDSTDVTAVEMTAIDMVENEQRPFCIDVYEYLRPVAKSNLYIKRHIKRGRVTCPSDGAHILYKFSEID